MNQNNQNESTPGAITLSSPVERMYHAWDEALSRNDAAALTALYAPDAVIESPLIPHLMGLERALAGEEEIRAFWEKLAQRKPPVRKYYRTGYLTDGKKLMWEYPRETPSGDQMDFAEVMELNREGLIQKYRVYWGWFGFGVLKSDEYHK
ncbi:MAG: nuclear transport factor 2 family protein [Acidobacteriaceae bacterium]|nr:nuclear transport factor 2 family protein [Acidobacteriaceae bacterium]MBV9763507.1 nuclear transport factor 2 family protein [Acidobacteriaceae bacterium]